MDLKDFSSTLRNTRPKLTPRKRVTFSIPATDIREPHSPQRPLKEVGKVSEKTSSHGDVALAIESKNSATTWQDVIQAALSRDKLQVCNDDYTQEMRIRETNRKMRHLLHISGRMKAGSVTTSQTLMTPRATVTCNCPKEPPEPPQIVVCEKCGGYSYNGETCSDSGSVEIQKPIKNKSSPYPSCPCCLSKSDRQGIKDRFYKKRQSEGNPLLGPHADKILPFFEHGNKGKYPAIVGYSIDGTPIFGPVPAESGKADIIAYSRHGTPIPRPGTGGPNDKSLVMGYTKDGKPIVPPSNIAPKEAMAILGIYEKDKSPVIGNMKLAGGMIHRGFGKDGKPKYLAAPAGKVSLSKGKKEKAEDKPEPQPAPKKNTHNLAKDIRQFYPSTKHTHCVPIIEQVPQKMSWMYKPKPEPQPPKKTKKSCTSAEEDKLPFWIPDGFKPGAVALRVAMKIRKDRGKRPAKSPYMVSGCKFKKCFCPKYDCDCTNCSQKRLEQQLQKKFCLPDSAFD